jgi:hypothetical protein
MLTLRDAGCWVLFLCSSFCMCEKPIRRSATRERSIGPDPKLRSYICWGSWSIYTQYVGQQLKVHWRSPEKTNEGTYTLHRTKAGKHVRRRTRGPAGGYSHWSALHTAFCTHRHAKCEVTQEQTGSAHARGGGGDSPGPAGAGGRRAKRGHRRIYAVDAHLRAEG